MLIAVSGCLLGQKVRFDKGHKRDSFVMDELSTYADYVSFCPENMAFDADISLDICKEPALVTLELNKVT